MKWEIYLKSLYKNDDENQKDYLIFFDGLTRPSVTTLTLYMMIFCLKRRVRVKVMLNL